MRDEPELTLADLATLFTPAREERIGLEVECGLVDPRTGQNVGYHHSHSFLDALLHELDGAPIEEAGALVGVELPGGAQVSLELGGAIEYSSAPYRSLTDLVGTARRDMLAVTFAAHRLGLSILPGALLPFPPPDGIPWAPKPRIGIMRDYFHRLGPPASYAERVMGLTLSTQTTVDFLSPVDFREKLRLLAKVAPIAAALFVNSPLDDGQPAGVLSHRMRMWERVDPARCGMLGFTTAMDVSTEDVLRWALDLPMIYRHTHGGYTPAPDRTFAELMRDGFGDGTRPDLGDWRAHLSQVWPHVRARNTLEMRAFDGLGWSSFAAGPAFVVGLAYHAPSRRAALALLSDLTGTDLARATGDVAAKGLDALAGRHSVGALVEALLGLARQGLRARVDAGIDAAEGPDLLDPLDEVVRTGVTFAERYLSDWAGPFRERPDALVAAHRIPPPS
jgi:glutamate--cysteine ligase